MATLTTDQNPPARWAGCVFLIFSLCIAASSHADQNIFLKIPGIKGDSLDSIHMGAIDVFSASGNFNPRTCGDFVITKYIDSSTPDLISSVVRQKGPVDITVIYRSDTAESFDYMILELKTSFLVNLEATNTVSENLGMESLSIRANRIKVTYMPRDDTGSPLAPTSKEVPCRRSNR